MRRILDRMRRRLADERGGVMIMVALGLPAFLGFGIFVIDVGNWWVHKRHVQIQADAAALAGAREYRFPGCQDNPIVAEATRYSGGQLWDPAGGYTVADANAEFNHELGGDQADTADEEERRSRTFAGVNVPSPYERPDPVIDEDLEDYGGPCAKGFVDVKVTETDVPWFLQFLPDAWMPFMDDTPPCEVEVMDPETGVVTTEEGSCANYIDAEARVTLQTLTARGGALPIGVEDVEPQKAHVWFFDETNGQLLGEADLRQDAPLGRLNVWSNRLAVGGAPVTFSPHTDKIAVRVGVSGLDTTDWTAADVCSQSLVMCYGYGMPATAPATTGLTRIRGYDTTTGTGVRVGAVRLVPATCTDTSLPTGAENGYFARSCTHVNASVELVGASHTAGTLKGRVDGMGKNQQITFTPPATAADPWTATLPLDLAEGAHKLALEYTESSTVCPTKTPCVFDNVHASFKGSNTNAGPLKMLQVGITDAAGNWQFGDNNVPRCAAAAACERSFVVSIGLVGDLALAQPGDPPIALKVFDGSRGRMLDCDPGYGQPREEIANGCRPVYAKNTGTACPATYPALQATPQPWQCAAIQTGVAASEFARGLNTRIFGSEKPATCPAAGLPGHNNWQIDADPEPDYEEDDPRILPLFRVPFGSYEGSGNVVVPVIGFASFYVTGWEGNGGFQSPCRNDGDVIEPSSEGLNGVVSGYFVIRVESNDGGNGTDGSTCDTTSIGGCVAVMTK